MQKYTSYLPDGRFVRNVDRGLMNTIAMVVNMNVIVKKEYYVYSIYLSSIDVNTYVDRFGKTIFLTREEAEKKMEEMKAND